MAQLLDPDVDALLAEVAQNMRTVLEFESLLHNLNDPCATAAVKKMRRLVSQLKILVTQSLDLVHALKSAVLQYGIVDVQQLADAHDEGVDMAETARRDDATPGSS